MAAQIISLTFCNTCHKRIKKKEAFTQWEGSIYCDSCFEEYLDMVTPAELFSGNESMHTPKQ